MMKPISFHGLLALYLSLPSATAARFLTVYTTHNTTLAQNGYLASRGPLGEFPSACPIFMPLVDMLTEEDPPGIVVKGAAPAPDNDLPDDIDLFNPQTGRWFIRYNDTEAPQYMLIRYEGLGLGNCTALRNGPTRCCTDYNGVKAEAQLAFDCLWEI